jgi:predicted alpha/beta superfamily hydrolase
MDWLVKAMKPIIDRRLRTLPDREHTLICGSSMGGLMALYAGTVYNQHFSRAACLSPSLWVDPQALLDMVRECDLGTDTCIYMDYGSLEISNHPAMIRALGEMAALLYEKRVDLNFRIIPGGSHCEASWEKQIPVFLHCLGV